MTVRERAIDRHQVRKFEALPQLGAMGRARGDSDQFFTSAKLKKALFTSSSASISRGMDGEKAMSLRTGNIRKARRTLF